MVSKRNSTSSVPNDSGGSTSGGRGFNVTDFRAYKDKAGLLYKHDFHVEMPFPKGMNDRGKYNYTWHNIELACDTCNFPATALKTYNVQRYSYGAMQKNPTISSFSDLHCTFLCDRESKIWQFFHDWMRLVVNYDFERNSVSGGTMDVYEISYRQDYEVDLFLYIYDAVGTLVRKVGFRSAYPVLVEDIPMDWAGRNQYIKVPVTFSFIDWTEIKDIISL